MFREGNSLLIKVRLIMMALALALVMAAVVSVALRAELKLLVAAEVATKSPGQAPRPAVVV